MAFPGSKVHRTNRRKLGKGQHVQPVPAAITAVASVDTAVLTFDRPVVVNGPIPYVTSSGAVSGQVQNSPTQVTITCTGSQAAATWSIAANCGAIATYQGGGNTAAGGTF